MMSNTQALMTSQPCVFDVNMADDDVLPYSSVLEPLYSVTNLFLGSILQPHTLPELQEKLDTDLTQTQDILNSFTDQWQVWARYLIGYVVLIAFGALFIIVLPIAGLFVCSCRCCCGNCGGKDHHTEPKRGKCKRVSCCLVLLLLTTICLIGVVCATLANVALREQTLSSSGALSDVQVYFKVIDDYVIDTVDELDDVVIRGYQESKDDVFQTLDDVGPHTRDVLGDVTKAGPLLDTLVIFTNNLRILRDALSYSKNTTDFLQSQGNTLSTVLSTLKDDINADVSLCSPTVSSCTKVLQLLPDLSMDVNYDDLGDLSLAVLAIDYVINDDIVAQVSQGLAEFENIAENINQTWSAQVMETKTQANTIEAELKTLILDVSTQIKDLNLTGFSTMMDDLKEPVETYGDYRFYASIGLSALLGLIVALIYMGLLCGACCKRPSYYKKLRCSTRCGSNTLLAASGFIFIFAWLQMLILLVLFVAGGAVYTELCRHLVNFGDDPVIEVVDGMLMKSLNLSLSIQNVTKQCEQNESVYNALQLENFGVNITEILNIDSYGFHDIIDQFKTMPMEIGDITIFSQATNETLQVLEIGLNTVNFTQFFIILAQNVTAIKLEDLAVELDAAAVQITTGPLSDRLTAHASTLRNLQDITVTLLEDMADNLTKSLLEIEDITNQTPIHDLIDDLTNSQDNLNENGNTLIKGIVNDTMDDLLSIMTSLMTSLDDDIRNRVGRCEPLYVSVTGIIAVGCENVLNPLNGFSAAHGWTLILFIPMLVMAMKLGGYYRVSLSFSSVTDGDEGDRNCKPYDAYDNAANDGTATPSTSRGEKAVTLKMKDFKRVGTLERDSHA